MALHFINNELHSVDPVQQRTQMGTVAGDHLSNSAVKSQKAIGIIDDCDPQVSYGIKPGYNNNSGIITYGGARPWASRGTYTELKTPGLAAKLTFTSSTISVLCDATPDSGAIDIYIDGVLTPGRLSTTATLHIGSGTPGQPAVYSTDTTITIINGYSNFSTTGGTILIGDELITYTSRSATVLSGCTRGVNGTVAANHYLYETVYAWGYSLDLGESGTDNNLNKKIVYYNNQLSAGQHTIEVVAKGGALGYSNVFFEGFVVGSLLGAPNINFHTEVTFVTFTTDGNGYGSSVNFLSTTNDEAIIGVIGYSQISPSTESGGTTTMGKIGFLYPTGQDAQPQVYMSNGPVSATVTVAITFAYLGVAL